MIVVKLKGGIGNQLFQYAAARRLAFRHNTVLKLDTAFLDRARTPREFELKHFNIVADIASEREIEEITGRGKNRADFAIERLRKKIGLARLYPTVFKERRLFHFDPSLLTAPDNIYLDGSWQSAKYFNDIEEIIRKECIVKYPLHGRNLEIAGAIKTVNSVALHVRRGDYVTDPETSKIHGNVCGLDYCHRCIAETAARITNPHYFIFSDDPDWVKSNLKCNYPITFIDHNGTEKAFEDLRLMSLCKHQIMANSSFSWWGAWLNDNPGKIVIAPRKWFNHHNINTYDLIPHGWQCL